MKSKLFAIILVFLFMSFISTPSVVCAFNLDLDTSVCFQTNEEEQETISKVDIKQFFKESSTFSSFLSELSNRVNPTLLEVGIKDFAIDTFSPPPEGIS